MQYVVKSLSVFCGSCMGFDDHYRKVAENLGVMLAQKDIKLIYGGSNIGLMRILADSVLDNNGQVVGIMPSILIDRNVSYNRISQLIKCDTMSERKNMMIEMSDAFVALPGGFGTMDEITEVLTHHQLNSMSKPLVLLNIDHFYDNFMAHIDLCVEKGFVRTEHRDNIIVVDNLETMFERLYSYHPVYVENKWVDKIIENTNYIINQKKEK